MRTLSLATLLFVLPPSYALIPFEVRTFGPGSQPPSHLGKRAVPITNHGNAAYMTNISLAGVSVSCILDTGSSDLWLAFPGTPPTTTDTGKSLSLGYAVGSVAGNIHTGQAVFDNYTIADQAFLQVANASSFSSDSAFNGLVGLGPSDGSSVADKLDSGGDPILTRIFQQSKDTANYITFLLNRVNDPGETFTGSFSISEPVPGYENITSQTKLNVETVHRLLEDQQHWQALTDANSVIGPDGNVINIDSIVPKAPDGQLVAVFDSGFTFSQVPRDLSDAIYGRVQGAVYDTSNQWWTVPCGQEVNVTFHFGGVAFPIHPLDVVDDNFKIKNTAGQHVCIGAFQPITSAFSLFGNFDMIMGMTFMRNAYTLMDFGDWASDTEDQGDPYMQLLPLTNRVKAHQDFVNIRLNGTDTTGSSQYALLPAAQQQHSPVSEEEKKKKYEEMILSRWPYILAGCLVGVLLLVGLIVWRCCCRKRANRKGGFASRFGKNNGGGNPAPSAGFIEQKSETYLPLKVQSPQPGNSPYGHEQQPSQASFHEYSNSQASFQPQPQSQYNQHEYGNSQYNPQASASYLAPSQSQYPPPSQIHGQGYPQEFAQHDYGQSQHEYGQQQHEYGQQQYGYGQTQHDYSQQPHYAH